MNEEEGFQELDQILQISNLYDPEIRYQVNFKLFEMDTTTSQKVSESFRELSYTGSLSYISMCERNRYIGHTAHNSLFDDFVDSTEKSSIVGSIGEIIMEELTLRYLPIILDLVSITFETINIDFPRYKTPDRITQVEVIRSNTRIPVIIGLESKGSTSSGFSSQHQKIISGLKRYYGSSEYSPSLNFGNLITGTSKSVIPDNLFELSDKINGIIYVDYEIVIPAELI